ncbi:ferritin-like domain-containing protein [Paradesertivirga mongoliensis]|uniref:Ferritin-like domain-containing protein n=1 Tax=Paradesertivirga mongoliensis TaxID=2100740 RepID=A0ABW4ZI92_9SPHI|nr:ferritin-like domain-containing protein [Pedobacter mongoliensis]
MENSTIKNQEASLSAGEFLEKKVQRRSFLRYAGAGAAGVVLVAAGCKQSNYNPDDPENGFGPGISLGTGDVAILNYAYALEQLEAAFYTQVIATPFTGMTAVETSLLKDIRDHEIAHREFFKAAIAANGGTPIKNLTVDFSSINFSSRASVLGTAKAFEDLGVSAYDGAGYLLQNATFLLLAGKIVSVEARHAALIREMLETNSFLGDQVDSSSVNISRTPAQVLAIAAPFIKTKIDPSTIPA